MGSFAPTLPIGTLNVALSNYAKEFRNNAFVGDLIAPRVSVDRESFQYLVFDRSNQRLDRQTLRAPGTRPQQDRMTYSALPYFCKSHALEAAIPYESERRSLEAGFSLKQKATARLVDKIGLDRENYIAQLVTNTANIANYSTLSGSSMWDPTAGGHPIVAVEAAKAVIQQSGVSANTLILSDPVFRALKNHPDIIARFQYTMPGAIGLSQLSEVFGVNCVPASAIILDKGNNPSFVWGVCAVLAYVQPVSDQMDISALKTFDWSEAPDTVGGYGVLEYPDPYLSAKTDWISCDWYWDIRVTGSETCFSFLNCVQAPAMVSIPAPTQF